TFWRHLPVSHIAGLLGLRTSNLGCRRGRHSYHCMTLCHARDHKVDTGRTWINQIALGVDSLSPPSTMYHIVDVGVASVIRRYSRLGPKRPMDRYRQTRDPR